MCVVSFLLRGATAQAERPTTRQLVKRHIRQAVESGQAGEAQVWVYILDNLDRIDRAKAQDEMASQAKA